MPRAPYVSAEGPVFPAILREWRLHRRVSQLALALDTGVSQRHLSFLESGRARPSRAMVLQLTDALEVPLRDRNAWLLAAGFAPAFGTRPIDAPDMAPVRDAVRLMLDNHEPFPALAIDRAWNVGETNAAFERLAGMLGDDVWTRVGGPPRNLMRLFFHPAGVRPHVENWAAVAPLLWQRARREAAALGGRDMQAVLDALRPHQDEETLRASGDVALVPVLPLTLALGAARLSLFTVIATFGTAQDVTADELRLECLFPADAATDRALRIAAGAA